MRRASLLGGSIPPKLMAAAENNFLSLPSVVNIDGVEEEFTNVLNVNRASRS
jgi:hypothetical protein